MSDEQLVERYVLKSDPLERIRRHFRTDRSADLLEKARHALGDASWRSAFHEGVNARLDRELRGQVDSLLGLPLHREATSPDRIDDAVCACASKAIGLIVMRELGERLLSGDGRESLRGDRPSIDEENEIVSEGLSVSVEAKLWGIETREEAERRLPEFVALMVEKVARDDPSLVVEREHIEEFEDAMAALIDDTYGRA